MFVWNAQTRTFWFNHLSMDTEQDFLLVGMILGLAIYNGVILDVHFPLVAFKKLLNKQPDFQVRSSPYRSMQPHCCTFRGLFDMHIQQPVLRHLQAPSTCNVSG